MSAPSCPQSAPSQIARLGELKWDNRFARDLPADPSSAPGRRQVFGAAYSRVVPTPVSAPTVVAYCQEMLRELGLSEAAATHPSFAQCLAGNTVLPQMQPLAHCYGGHQFGNWAGQLGDGRAMSLGEVTGADGSSWELQLKGAGPTPYSRGADGRAVLRSSLREFVCSEAMYHLGVPTTRALSLVRTGDWVERDMLYDGHARLEPGAVVCRVAPSFLRFGSFELPASRGDSALLHQLLSFCIQRHYPELLTPAERNQELVPLSSIVDWFSELAVRTALMVAHWMRVGFVHGVMNTDNMSALGLTLDYGPYGWVDNYDPDWTPNTTDAETRRYRFGHQGRVALWNLVRLAEALLPLGVEQARLRQGLERYEDVFAQAEGRMQLAKLGLLSEKELGPSVPPSAAAWQGPLTAEQLQLLGLVERLQRILTRQEVDFTLLYRRLAGCPLGGSGGEADEALRHLAPSCYAAEGFRPDVAEELADWLAEYGSCVSKRGFGESRPSLMDSVNPLYVPRNYLVQQVIESVEAGEMEPLERLMSTLRQPYTERPGRAQYAEKRPEWARSKPGCSQLSCSS